MLLRKLISFLLILLSCSVYAQDIHFSHREAYLNQRNSSLASLYEGEWQLNSSYRRQWASISVPFISSQINLNKKFYLNNRSIILNGGIHYNQDKSGDSELMINRYLLQAGGVYRYLQHEFSLSTQFGFVSKQLSNGNLTMPSQFDRETGGFNIQLPGGESLQQTSLSYFDVNFSIGWKFNLNEKWTLGAGYSLQHINQAEESFLDRNNQLPLGTGLQLFGIYNMTESDRLKPVIYDYRTKKASETMIGLEWEHDIEQYETFLDYFYIGAHSRQGFTSNLDALIWNGGVGFKGFRVGMAYDLNVSDLELATGNQGSLEFQIIYTGKITSLKKIAIPCEHY